MELTLQQWADAVRVSGIRTKDFAGAIRIENTVLSVAKHAGGARLNGELYLYVNPVDERTMKRVDLIVCKPLLEWAQNNMGMHAVSDKPKRVPLARQMELL